MDNNLNYQMKSPNMNYYKAKYKKKPESNISNNNNNNALYTNDLFTKNSLKVKGEFKFRTSKNSPLYTKRKIEVNEDINNGPFTGGSVKNTNNDDLLNKKIRKLYKKSGHFSQIHNNSSNLIKNNSKNESSSIIVNKFNKTKKLFYNNYNNNNFDYNIKLNHYIGNNSAEENNNINNNPNTNISLKNNNNYISSTGLIKQLENKENKNDILFKKINNKPLKHQSITKIKKISNINYLNNNNGKINLQNPIDYSKYLKKYNESNNSGTNIITQKINKIINPNDYSNSFIDYNKLSKTSYLSKNNSGKNSLDKKMLKIILIYIALIVN